MARAGAHDGTAYEPPRSCTRTSPSREQGIYDYLIYSTRKHPLHSHLRRLPGFPACSPSSPDAQLASMHVYCFLPYDPRTWERDDPLDRISRGFRRAPIRVRGHIPLSDEALWQPTQELVHGAREGVGVGVRRQQEFPRRP